MGSLIKCYPNKAQFIKGDNVGLIIELSKELNLENIKVKIEVNSLGVLEYKEEIPLKDYTESLSLNIKSFKNSIKGYEVKCTLIDKKREVESYYTAFDIVECKTLCTRYGFISDFFNEDTGKNEDIKSLNEYHINYVQYYDWMYRHHDLIPKESLFIDPLGRKLSLDTVKEKIREAHKYGMQAIFYGAVYGSEKEYYEKHKEEALYKNNGEVIDFANFIYIMDINKENPWHDHIINEFCKGLKLGFDGIHLDQYGFPKEAIGLNKVRNLSCDFVELINDMKKVFYEKELSNILIFNAVNNWPIEKVSKSKEDIMYIEVWSPHDSYRDLYELITNAKRHAPNKNVILAAYMKPFIGKEKSDFYKAENATILTMATIFASGGYHLLLGEEKGILTEGYYPNYVVDKSPKFLNYIKNYYDFIVKYEELLYDFNIQDVTDQYTGGINNEYLFKGASFSIKPESNKVWTLVKKKENYKIIHLVNYTGLTEDSWNEDKEKLPSIVENIEVEALVAEKVKGIYMVSPDIENGNVINLPFTMRRDSSGDKVCFKVEKLSVWSMIFISC